MAHKKIPQPEPIDKIADEWVRTWGGELVNRNTAAAMLGVSRYTIRKWVDAGYLAAAPNGHIIVRQAAAFANANIKPIKSEYRLIV